MLRHEFSVLSLLGKRSLVHTANATPRVVLQIKWTGFTPPLTGMEFLGEVSFIELNFAL